MVATGCEGCAGAYAGCPGDVCTEGRIDGGLKCG